MTLPGALERSGHDIMLKVHGNLAIYTLTQQVFATTVTGLLAAGFFG